MKLKKTRANTFNTGIAAEYFILSQLYRLGIEAYISQGNKKAIDIRVIKEDETSISIDVKAVRDYSSLVVNNVISKKNHFVVFVTYNKKFEKIDTMPEVFIVPSKDVVKITRKFKEEKRVMKGDLINYKDRWDYLI
jgi:hypothetical protein